jgi:transposase-like protein
VARRQNSARQSALKAEVKQILGEDQDLWKALMTATLQQTLEAEMDEALAAEKSERTDNRLGYRCKYYGRG